jgi:hypothetical protein
MILETIAQCDVSSVYEIKFKQIKYNFNVNLIYHDHFQGKSCKENNSN